MVERRSRRRLRCPKCGYDILTKAHRRDCPKCDINMEFIEFEDKEENKDEVQK